MNCLLQSHVTGGPLLAWPPRDYALQYSNTKILQMYSNGELTKTDTTAVKAKIKSMDKPVGKISDEDPIILNKGDWRCRFCDMAELCYSNTPGVDPKPVVAKPVVVPADLEPDTLPDIS